MGPKIDFFMAFTAPFLIGAGVLLVAYSKLYFDSANDFQRYGSAMVAFGIAFFAVFGSTKTNAERMLEENKSNFGPVVRAIVFITLLIEIALLIGGTLIWGYGDLFHCWFNGNGWIVC